MSLIKQYLLWLGPMRVALFASALIVVALVPDPQTQASYHGSDLFFTVLIPVLTPLIMMVLLLDALMGRVWLADARGAEREEAIRRYRTIVRLDLAATALVFLAWLPFFMALGR